MKETHKNFYDELRTTRNASLYNLVFLWNRFTTVLLLILPSRFAIIILQVTLAQMVMKASYITAVRPFKIKKFNNTEIANDLSSIMFIYLVMAMMHGGYPDGGKVTIGWYLIGNEIALLLGHIIAIVVSMIR